MSSENLVLLHEVINSSGLVTTMSTGTISALSVDKVYKFQIGIRPLDYDTYSIYFNGDTTATNYKCSSLTSNSTFSNANTSIGPYSTSTMNFCFGGGYISYVNGYPAFYLNMTQYASLQNERMVCAYMTSTQAITKVQITSTTANNINITSYLRIWEAIQ